MNWRDTTHKTPIKDLARLNHKITKVEVLTLDFDVGMNDFENPVWSRCRL